MEHRPSFKIEPPDGARAHVDETEDAASRGNRIARWVVIGMVALFAGVVAAFAFAPGFVASRTAGLNAALYFSVMLVIVAIGLACFHAGARNAAPVKPSSRRSPSFVPQPGGDA